MDHINPCLKLNCANYNIHTEIYFHVQGFQQEGMGPNSFSHMFLWCFVLSNKHDLLLQSEKRPGNGDRDPTGAWDVNHSTPCGPVRRGRNRTRAGYWTPLRNIVNLACYGESIAVVFLKTSPFLLDTHTDLFLEDVLWSWAGDGGEMRRAAEDCWSL